METNESMGALFAALARAQGQMANATLNKINPHFKSRYADLAAIREAVTPALTANDLCVAQVIQHGASGPVLVTVLGHKSGAAIESHHPLPLMGKPQEFGSALSYARRYSIAALCGIGAEEDDDANAANAAAPSRPAIQLKEIRPLPEKADDRAAQWVAKMRKQIAACSSVDELGGLDAAAAPAMNKLAATHPDDHKALRDLFAARAEALSKELAHV